MSKSLSVHCRDVATALEDEDLADDDEAVEETAALDLSVFDGFLPAAAAPDVLMCWPVEFLSADMVLKQQQQQQQQNLYY